MREKAIYLQDYLQQNEISIRKFARRIGSSTRAIHYIIYGTDTKLSFAMEIEKKTKKQVTCEKLMENFANNAKKVSDACAIAVQNNYLDYDD